MKKQKEEEFDLMLDRAFEDVLLDMIKKYPSPEELKGTQKFSAEHEKKMQDIIRNAQKREQHNTSRQKNRLLRIGINAAAVFGFLCLIATLMAFTVLPIRIALKNFFLTTNESYTDIEMQADEEEFKDEIYNFPTYIPSGFEIENTIDNNILLTVLYTNKSEQYISFERYIGEVGIMANEEGMDFVDIMILENKGRISNNNGTITVVFFNSEYSYKITSDIIEKEVIKIAESITKKK